MKRVKINKNKFILEVLDTLPKEKKLVKKYLRHLNITYIKISRDITPDIIEKECSIIEGLYYGEVRSSKLIKEINKLLKE